MPYADLDDDAQVEVLRPAALAGAAALGLGVARMEPVAHAFLYLLDKCWFVFYVVKGIGHQDAVNIRKRKWIVD